MFGAPLPPTHQQVCLPISGVCCFFLSLVVAFVFFSRAFFFFFRLLSFFRAATVRVGCEDLFPTDFAE